MSRVAFVLRATECHPDCDELCHTKRKPVPLIEDSGRHVDIFFCPLFFQIDKHEVNANFFRCGFSEKLKIERKGKRKKEKGKRKKGKKKMEQKRKKGNKGNKGNKEQAHTHPPTTHLSLAKFSSRKIFSCLAHPPTHPPTHHVSLSRKIFKSEKVSRVSRTHPPTTPLAPSLSLSENCEAVNKKRTKKCEKRKKGKKTRKRKNLWKREKRKNEKKKEKKCLKEQNGKMKKRERKNEKTTERKKMKKREKWEKEKM